MSKQIKFTVNGIECRAEEGEFLLAAAKKNAKSLSEGVYETDPDVAKLFDEFCGIMREYGLEALLSTIANTPLNVPVESDEMSGTSSGSKVGVVTAQRISPVL